MESDVFSAGDLLMFQTSSDSHPIQGPHSPNESNKENEHPTIAPGAEMKVEKRLPFRELPVSTGTNPFKAHVIADTLSIVESPRPLTPNGILDEFIPLLWPPSKPPF
jgi:hypothetical protein